MLHLTRSFRIQNSVLVQSDMAENKQPPPAAPAAEEKKGDTTFARAWCFTFNNYQLTQDYDRKLRDAFPNDFVVYGKEVGDSGTPHLQGFVYVASKIRFKNLKERFDTICAGVHIEKARTTKAAIMYCKKGSGTPSAPVEADVVQWGAEPGQGARNDLEMVATAIAEGASRKRLAEEFPTMVIKFNRGLDALMALQREPFAEEKEIIWCCGPSGSGKTMWARNYLTKKYGDYYEKSSPTKWWDQYDGDKGVLLDEFRDVRGEGHITFRDLLTILGTGRKYLEVKGGVVALCARTIIVTSVYEPLEVFKDNDLVKGEEMVQLTRRINTIYRFKRVEQNLPREPEVREIMGYRPDLPEGEQYQVLRQGRINFGAAAAAAAPAIHVAMPDSPEPGPAHMHAGARNSMHNLDLSRLNFLVDEGEPIDNISLEASGSATSSSSSSDVAGLSYVPAVRPYQPNAQGRPIWNVRQIIEDDDDMFV